MLSLFRRTIEHIRRGDYDFRAVVEDAPQGFRCCSSLRHNCDVGLIFKQTSQALPKQYYLMHEGATDIPILVDLCVGAQRNSFRPEKM
jgi:hypothetical protein